MKINFKYKFPEDYNPTYINGAFGGATPKGEIVANFFLERQAIPYEESQNVDGFGRIIPTKNETVEEIDVVRYVSTGVVLSLESAKDIYNWLGSHIQQLEMEGKKG